MTVKEAITRLQSLPDGAENYNLVQISRGVPKEVTGLSLTETVDAKKNISWVVSFVS